MTLPPDGVCQHAACPDGNQSKAHAREHVEEGNTHGCIPNGVDRLVGKGGERRKPAKNADHEEPPHFRTEKPPRLTQLSQQADPEAAKQVDYQRTPWKRRAPCTALD